MRLRAFILTLAIITGLRLSPIWPLEGAWSRVVPEKLTSGR